MSALFLLAALAILVTPGPAVLYIVATAIRQGRLAGFVSGLGLSIGGVTHVMLAWLGVSALLLARPGALRGVQIAGAAYLVVLGVRALRTANGSDARDAAHSERSLLQVFRDGVIVNLLNPKSALFLLAFLPQFVDPAKGEAQRQLLVLGLIFVGLGLLTDALWAMTAGTLGAWWRDRPGTDRWVHRFGAATYLTLGVLAAFR
ncbi:MAG TPA: LysE family translocator [Candidatus Polarisedimenticolaceae bacterium]